MPLNRRTLVKLSALAATSPLTSACSQLDLLKFPSAKAEINPEDWLKADQIRANIVVPAFANNDFFIVDYGARPGPGRDNSKALTKAIRACHNAGGGRVVIPPGVFYTGPIVLRSNVNLYLSEGATLKFFTDATRYLPAVVTRWEGMELMGYSPLVYAYGQTNIAITGLGTLDGSASNQNWWPWKGEHPERHWKLIKGEDQKFARLKLMRDMENNIPIAKRQYAAGAYLRPPLFQAYSCDNVLVEGVTVKNSPFWLLHPVLCHSVTVRNVNLDSHGPNSDGCNPESCDHVLIENCNFNTGDDCIAIKSGRNSDGRRINVPCKNVVIANCNMRDGHGGVVIGSEISGGVNNVFVENCNMNSPLLERALRIKTNSVRGGVIEHLRYRNIQVGDVKNGFVVNFYYEEGDAGNFDPTVRDIVIENFTCKNVLEKPLFLKGFNRKPISNISLINCHFNRGGEPSVVKNIDELYLENVTIDGEEVKVKKLMKG